MNIRNVARKWLMDHGHTPNEYSFEKNLNDLCDLIDQIIGHGGHTGYEPEYDPQFGDDKICLCGHPYYRHFDTYDNMAPIGCKYCTFGYLGEYGSGYCSGFQLEPEHKEDCGCKSCVGM